MSEFDSIEEELKFMADCSDDRGDSETSLMFVRYLAHIRKLNAELAALKEGQGEAVEFCCEASFEAAKQEAWTARDLKLCTCDHHEYCGHCWPDDFKPGGKWHDGFLVKQQHQVASPPASADARLVPVELLHAAARLLKSYQEVIDNCHSSELERFDYQPEVQGAADELRALLARQEAKP